MLSRLRSRVADALPQGQLEHDERTLNMVAAMAREEFGSCTNHAECEAACPKGIPLEFIAGLNRDLIRAAFRRHREPLTVVGAPQHPAYEDIERTNGTDSETDRSALRAG